MTDAFSTGGFRVLVFRVLVVWCVYRMWVSPIFCNVALQAQSSAQDVFWVECCVYVVGFLPVTPYMFKNF